MLPKEVWPSVNIIGLWNYGLQANYNHKKVRSGRGSLKKRDHTKEEDGLYSILLKMPILPSLIVQDQCLVIGLRANEFNIIFHPSSCSVASREGKILFF